MSLGWLDIFVLTLYFVGVLGVGLWVGRRERSTKDFFLGGRKQHWLLAGISIVATEVSALTFVVVPGDAFKGDWNYLQMYAGAFTGRVIVAYLLLPAFYGGSVTTVYEYLGQRFGPWTRTTASIFFFASRTIGSGIRLLAGAIAVSVVFGWRLEWVLIGSVIITIAYTSFGGIKAILWTDVLQAAIFVAAPLAAIVLLFHYTPGLWSENLTTAVDAGKLHVFTWDKNLNNDKSFWVLFIHATVLNIAVMGTDQDMTQRMLTCPDLKRGRKSLIFNAFIGLPVVMTFLFVGTMLWVFYQSPETAVPNNLPDDYTAHHERVFPHFIAHSLPSGYGIQGLLLAGIFATVMSSLASALGALSSSAINDLYRPFVRDRRSDRHFLMSARLMTIFFGILLTAVAIAFSQSYDLLWKAFQWVGLILGGMLGVFLLGVLTRSRGNDQWNVSAMLLSVALLVTIKYLQERKGVTWLAWPWWIVLGTGCTFFIGALGCTKSFVMGQNPMATPLRVRRNGNG